MGHVRAIIISGDYRQTFLMSWSALRVGSYLSVVVPDCAASTSAKSSILIMSSLRQLLRRFDLEQGAVVLVRQQLQ